MKTFKFSSIFLSLMAALTFAVLFTSCSKENLDTVIEEKVTPANQENATKILLPEEVTSQGTEAIKAYLENMSDEQKVKHINDYTISEYLTQKGKIKNLDPNGNTVGLPSDLNLSDHLTGDEVKELKEQLITTEDLANNPRLAADCYAVYALVGCIWLTNGQIVIEICHYELIAIICIF